MFGGDGADWLKRSEYMSLPGMGASSYLVGAGGGLAAFAVWLRSASSVDCMSAKPPGATEGGATDTEGTADALGAIGGGIAN